MLIAQRHCCRGRTSSPYRSVPSSLIFTMLFRLPPGHEKGMKRAKEWTSHYFTKSALRDIVFPGHYPHVTVEQLEKRWKMHCKKRKWTPLMEEAKRERERNRGNRHKLECRCPVKVRFPTDTCSLLPAGLHSIRSISNTFWNKWVFIPSTFSDH